MGTVGRSGMPQLTPNWYRFANGKLTISTTKERFKYRNLARDARIAVCIYSEPLASDYATLWGQTEISDDESHLAGDPGHLPAVCVTRTARCPHAGASYSEPRHYNPGARASGLQDVVAWLSAYSRLNYRVRPRKKSDTAASYLSRSTFQAPTCGAPATRTYSTRSGRAFARALLVSIGTTSSSSP